MAEDIA